MSLAVTDLSVPKVFFCFETLAVHAPRVNVVLGSML
jgi:hypothetical protein